MVHGHSQNVLATNHRCGDGTCSCSSPELRVSSYSHCSCATKSSACCASGLRYLDEMTAIEKLLARYRWVAIAGDSHLHMIFLKLVQQITSAEPRNRLANLTDWAGTRWTGSSLRLDAGERLPPPFVVAYETGNVTHDKAVRYSTAALCIRRECVGCQLEFAALGLQTHLFLRSLPTLVRDSLTGRPTGHGLCLTYTDMRLPSDESATLLFEHRTAATAKAARGPDALIIDPAVWVAWRGWSSEQYDDALLHLLQKATTRREVPSLRLAPRRVVLWSSSPTVQSLLAPHKANLTADALHLLAEVERRRVATFAGNGVAHLLYLDALRFGTAGWRAGRFAPHSDGVHWQWGACDDKRRAPSTCALFRQAAQLPATLYSCLWDETVAFLCATEEGDQEPVERSP